MSGAPTHEYRGYGIAPRVKYIDESPQPFLLEWFVIVKESKKGGRWHIIREAGKLENHKQAHEWIDKHLDG